MNPLLFLPGARDEKEFNDELPFRSHEVPPARPRPFHRERPQLYSLFSVFNAEPRKGPQDASGQARSHPRKPQHHPLLTRPQ